MDTNFHINPQGNSKNLINKSTGKQVSYMAARGNGLQQDTVNFTGKHKEHGDWKKKLLSALGLTTMLAGTAGTLAGCTPGQATKEDLPVETAPEQPKTEDLEIAYDYRAVLPEVTENYGSVQHLYLDKDVSFKSLVFAPSNLPKGVIQTIVSPEKDDEDNPLVGSTLRILIDKATPIEAICEANGIEDPDGAWHEAIHNYLQSNPDLAAHIATLNGVDNVEELTDDVIADTVLYNEGDKPLTLLGVIAPTFIMPLPGFGDENTLEPVLVQTQYAPRYTEDGHIVIDANKTTEDGNSYPSVRAAIIHEYDVVEGDKDPAFLAIAHQIANHPYNKEIIETYIQDLNIATAVDDVTSPEDNKRTQALLAMTDIEDLYLPDNILVNAVKHNTGDAEFEYTEGTKVYQLSARSPIGGENVHSVVLEEKIDPEADPTPNGIQKLEDVLKYYSDPRTGAPLAEVVTNEDGEVFVQSNVNDQLGKDLEVTYMVNAIKDHVGIFAATQNIGDELYFFGAYDIMNEDVVKFIDEQLAEARKDENITDEEAVIIARDAAVEKFGEGKIENFLEKYASLNLDRAKQINFYNEDGELAFKNEDGSPIEFKLSDAYVTFGKVSEIKTPTSSPTPGPGKSNTVTSSTPGPVSSTPGPVSSTPGPVSSTPGPISSTPGPISSTPGPISSTPGPISSTPGPISSTPGPISSTPGPISSTPGPISSTPGPISSTPGPISSTPGPVSSTPGPVSSTPGPVSSTPGPVSSTPGPVSSTPGPVSSAPGPVSSTPPSYTPSFNPDTPIPEPGDSKTPTSSTPGTTSSTPGPTSSTPGSTTSSCLPPPPPSNSATATKPNTVTGSKTVTSSSTVTTPSVSSTPSSTQSVTSSRTSSTPSSSSSKTPTTSSTSGSPGITSIGQADSKTPAPSSTYSSTPSSGGTTSVTPSSGGTTSVTPSSGGVTGSTAPVENKVNDKTSDVTQSSTKVEQRGDKQQAVKQAEPQQKQQVVQQPQAVQESEPQQVEQAAAPAPSNPVESVANVVSDETSKKIEESSKVEVRGQQDSAPKVEFDPDGDIVIEE